MLVSLVVQIEAAQTGSIRGGTGRAVHGLWFDQWKLIHPAFADQLHSQNNPAPYSLSPIMGLPRPHKGSIIVSEGTSAWFRIATFEHSLSELLLERWWPALSSKIELASLTWHVTGGTVSADDHPWAGQITYQDLIEQCLFQLPPPSKWQLEFATPTAFNSASGHLPFPLPDSLIKSWLRRWQVFASIGLPEDLPNSARESLLISSFNLNTVPVRYGSRLTVGCIGLCQIRASQLTPTIQAAIDLLASFAFFCGSGHHTTQGMGLTRMVNG